MTMSYHFASKRSFSGGHDVELTAQKFFQKFSRALFLHSRKSKYSTDLDSTVIPPTGLEQKIYDSVTYENENWKILQRGWV